MHSRNLVERLLACGLRLEQIAVETGLSYSICSHIKAGRRPGPRVQRELERLLRKHECPAPRAA